MLYRLIKRISWLLIAVACVCIGLKAIGVDMETMLHLEDMDMAIRYTIGALGAASLVMFFVERSMGSCCKS